jgi:Flp pilus assembly pilin Flp
MKVQLLGLFFKLQDLLKSEVGQDVVEYSMVFTMIALGAVVAMQSLDVAIAQVFTSISSTIHTALTQTS